MTSRQISVETMAVPAISANLRDDLRGAMRRLAASVNILTTSDEAGRWFGMTATAVMSLSFDPPSLLICLSRSSTTCKEISQSRKVCINILSEEQEDVAARFSSPTSREQRFAGGRWYSGRMDLPAIEGARANLFCDAVDPYNYGSHCIFICSPVEIITSKADKTLLYVDGSYAGSNPTHV